MAGLPAALLKKLKQTLLECGPFGSDRALKSVFAQDERLAPWKNQISDADRVADRVDYFISDFLERKNRAGQSVLVLFLQVLYDQTEEEDACSLRLNELAVEVAAAQGGILPPLAGNNLGRSAALLRGERLALGGYARLPAESSAVGQASGQAGGWREALPPGLPAGAFQARLESLKNKAKADWLPASFLEKSIQAARAVGRVEYQRRAIGTAFFVAPGLVLTNAHVARDIPNLAQGGVRFNVGLQAEATWRYFAAQVADSPPGELDFALLRLAPASDGTPSPSPLRLSAEPPYTGQPANILQYPQGQALQVALRYNEVLQVESKRVYYVTDTDAGSSGAPVFDDEWRVIALHRAGLVDEAGQPLPNANQGVPVTALLPHLHAYLDGGK